MTAIKTQKTFQLVQTASSPVHRYTWLNEPDAKIDLTNVVPASWDNKHIDRFRFGYNAFGVARATQAGKASPTTGDSKIFEFGIPAANRQVKPSHSYEDYIPGYAFGLGRFRGLGVGDNWITAKLNEVFDWEFSGHSRFSSPSQTFGDKAGSPLAAGQNGISASADRNYNSITGSFKTKQEFYVATALGQHPWDLQGASLDTDLPSWWYQMPEFNQVIQKTFDNKTFYDLAFTMGWPYPLKDFEELAVASIRENSVSIKPSYNFYVKQYEDGIAAWEEQHDQIFPVHILPSIYMFASELDNDVKDPVYNIPESKFREHINLGASPDGLIRDTFIDITDEGRKTGERDIGQHFQKFGNVLKTGEPSVTSSQGVNISDFSEYQNLIFPRENLNLLKNHQGKEKLFPAHVEIEFSTDVHTKFSDALRDAKLSSVLIKWIIANSSSAETYGDSNGWAQFVMEDWCTQADPADPCIPAAPLLPTHVSGSGGYQLVNPQGECYIGCFQNPPVWDFGKWVDGLLTQGDPSTLSDEWISILEDDPNSIFLGEQISEIAAAINPDYALFTMLMMHVFKNKAMGIVEDNFRTFEDLLRNNVENSPQDGRKPAYSETLVYCIKKSPVALVDGVAIVDDSGSQRIWFPNSSDIDMLKYIDTQVKWGGRYQYEIFAYQLVVGNKYTYKINDGVRSPEAGELGGDPASRTFWNAICLWNTPCLKLIQVPIYSSKWDNPDGIMINDSPPVPPDVHIIPYKGVNNKLLFWLNGSVGDFETDPIGIMTGDFPELPDGFIGKVHFKSDDPAVKFEVFKRDKRPISYKDFANDLLTTISSSEGTPRRSYVDTKITPNKKYYYTFRSIDVHGNRSNPSAVYECELAMQDEFVYPIIRTIDLGDRTDLEIVKPFKKFLEIKPAFSQTELKEQQIKTMATNTFNNGEIIDTTTLQTLANSIDFKNPGTSIWDIEPANGSLGVNKRYKIRIHSKKSGKKIDFNIDFCKSDTIKNDTDDES